MSNRTNGRFHGCSAWIIAVRTAERMPIGVRELRETARTTRKVVAKKAKMRFMLLRCSIWLFGEGKTLEERFGVW